MKVQRVPVEPKKKRKDCAQMAFTLLMVPLLDDANVGAVEGTTGRSSGTFNTMQFKNKPKLCVCCLSQGPLV